jgi:outer membrane protein
MRWLLVVVAALAVNVAVAAETKVGVIDMERALFLSDAAKSAVKKFEADNKDDIEKLKSLQKELMATQAKLEKEADIMGEEERRKLANGMEQKSSEYQFYGRKLKQLEDKWKKELFNEQLPELEKLLKEIIDEGKYDVVLNSGAVIYSSPSVDLTKLLLERLNTK